MTLRTTKYLCNTLENLDFLNQCNNEYLLKVSLMIRFLSSYSYKRDYGFFPNGELSHGDKGMLEYYSDLFSVQDNWQVLGMLKILANNNYRGHVLCPCGSNKKVRNCHGDLLREIRGYQKTADYLIEYINILNLLKSNNLNKNLMKYIPKEVIKHIKKKKPKLVTKKP